jgi:hypothetical protein
MNIILIFIKVQNMDNYFNLSSEDGDKWAQGSSQHGKCQVGSMHTYSLDLDNFPIIPSSFIQSLHFPP